MKQLLFFIPFIYTMSAQAEICDGFTAESDCQIQIRCTEIDPLSIFTEIEIGKTSAGFTLFKYQRSSAQQRTLMLMTSVVKTVHSDQVQYLIDANASSTSLTYNSTDMTGLFQEDVNGRVLSTDLTCLVIN